MRNGGGGRPRLATALSWVAVAIALTGVLMYVYLAVVTRSLSEAEYSWFGAFWSLSLVAGFGAFLPVEVELARLIHLRGTARPLPPGTLPGLFGIFGASLVVLAACSPVLLPALGHEPALYAALLLVPLVSAVQFLMRGILLGRGAYGTHGAVMVADTALRIALAAVVAVTVSDATAASFGWTLPAAVLLASAPVLVWQLRRRPDGPVADSPAASPRRADTVRSMGHLVVGSLSSQVLLNLIPVAVAGVATAAQQGQAGQFVASFTLVRLPLFVAVPLQSALVPSLTELHARGDRRAERLLVLRLLAGTVALAAVGAVVAFLLGPAVIGLLFGQRYAVSGAAMGVLTAGACLYAGMLVSGQALVAAGRHRASTAAWLTGMAIAVVVFVLVPGLIPRASLAFAGGSAAALATAGVLLLRGGRGSAGPAPVGDPALEGVFPAGPA